ncbi:MAG: RNA polymerase subunit sigma-24 [Firmicutes bacterium]|nr:RNA polymerase subunit sigma-24 [Bacillota bacterium]
MTKVKEVLKQIRKLRKEIDGLQDLIKDMSKNTVTDIVYGSSDEFPYVKRSFKIEGADCEKINRIKMQLIDKKYAYEKAVAKIEEFFDSVKDSEIRNILRLRYELGLTWNDVAIKCDSTEAAVRMRAERFLKKFS